MKLFNRQWLISILFLLVVVAAQNHPLDIANALDVEIYIQTWREATLEEVQAWLQSAPDVNAQGDWFGGTVLMWAAARNKHPEIITALLQAGADVNAQNIRDHTALIWAAGYNENPKVTEVIKLLIQAGADVNARADNGETALMWATKNNFNSAEIIATLLRAGADASIKNNDGKTALGFARENEDLQGTNALQQLQDASQ